jgi:hypothetical protein
MALFDRESNGSPKRSQLCVVLRCFTLGPSLNEISEMKLRVVPTDPVRWQSRFRMGAGSVRGLCPAVPCQCVRVEGEDVALRVRRCPGYSGDGHVAAIEAELHPSWDIVDPDIGAAGVGQCGFGLFGQTVDGLSGHAASQQEHTHARCGRHTQKPSRSSHRSPCLPRRVGQLGY